MLDELVQDILSDFTDEEGEPLVSDVYIRRQAERSLPVLSADLANEYQLNEEDVVPEMPLDVREVWVIRTKILLCRHLRAQASSRVSFSSGDKKMDRSKEAANWAALQKDLTDEYAARIKRLNPLADETLIQLEAHPLIFKRGSAV